MRAPRPQERARRLRAADLHIRAHQAQPRCFAGTLVTRPMSERTVRSLERPQVEGQGLSVLTVHLRVKASEGCKESWLALRALRRVIRATREANARARSEAAYGPDDLVLS